MNAERLARLLDAFPGKRLLVVGDVILDEYVWGSVSRISPEAPVPVVQLQRREYMPGGGAYVGSLVRWLEGSCDLVGVVGDDDRAATLSDLLKEVGVNVSGLVRDPSRPTTLKSRVIAQRQQIVRVDDEVREPVSRAVAKRLVDEALRRMKHVQGVVLSDYAKGALTPEVFQAVIRGARALRLPVTVDPKPAHCLQYRHVTAITPNSAEAGSSLGVTIEGERALNQVGQALLKKLGSACVLITRGEHGMSLFERGKGPTHIPTMAQEVFDVSGAGDTVISTFTLAVAAGATLLEAAQLSNLAAGVQVGKLGTAKVTREEVAQALARAASR